MPRLVRRNCRVLLVSLAIVTVLHIVTVGSDTRSVEQRYPPRPHHEYVSVNEGEFDDHIISDLLVNHKQPPISIRSVSSTEKNTTTTTKTTSTESTTKKAFRAVAVVAKKKVTTTKKTTTTTTKVTRKTIPTPPPSTCTKRPIVFLKTHKTASTSLTNIVLRWAEKNKFLVGLPPPKKWELGGYPAPFDPALVDPAAKEYDTLAHHFRWSEAVEAILNPDSFKISVLRDPVKNFESVWGFFRDYPFLQWLGEDRRLNTFLENPSKYYNRSTPWYFRAQNYMAFDLGLDFENNSDAYINEAFKIMERRFGLVLLTDYFEESLILLKDKTCMSMDDLKSLKLKVRKDADRSDLDPAHQTMIRNWNKLDAALYDHFLAVHNRLVDEYGREKMATELVELEKVNQAANDKCISYYDKHDNKPWISRIVLKPKADSLCRKMSWSEVLFGDTIRDNQRRSMRNRIKAIQKDPADLIKMLDKAQKTVLTSV